MNQKILAFVCDGKKLLILRNNSQDPTHGGDKWFTVTGGVEVEESVQEAIKREVKEETNLDVNEILDLNWGSVYAWGGKDYYEKNFLVFVKKGKIVLNEEHTEFEWLILEEFIRKIDWGLNKEELKKVLNEALKKEIYFKQEKIDDFRKKAA